MRNARLVVQIAKRFHHGKTLAEHGIKHFLCGGFPNAACNADGFNGIQAFVISGKRLKSLQGVLHADVRKRHFFLRKTANRACFKCGGDKIMPVKTLTDDGHKQIAGFCLAVINDNAGDLLFL